MSEHLSLKWGTLKSWNLDPDGPGMKALENYFEAGPVCSSAMLQRDSLEQVDALCALIDAVDAPTIYSEWDDAELTKDQAKAYVREYPR